MRAILVTISILASFVAFVPSAEAANGCIEMRGPCPGIVCYGTGSHHGYLVCVGPGYCDPDACEPIVKLCELLDNCEILDP